MECTRFFEEAYLSLILVQPFEVFNAISQNAFSLQCAFYHWFFCFNALQVLRALLVLQIASKWFELLGTDIFLCGPLTFSIEVKFHSDAQVVLP